MSRVNRASRPLAFIVIASFSFLASACSTAIAHPVGNFAICHYSRITPDPNIVHIRYVLDFAEIPTVSEKETLDPDHNGIITPKEEKSYRSKRLPELLSGLRLEVNGKPAVLKLERCDIGLSLGAGGLQTLKLSMDLSAPVDGGKKGRLAMQRYWEPW